MFTDPAPTDFYALSLHDALPICHSTCAWIEPPAGSSQPFDAANESMASKSASHPGPTRSLAIRRTASTVIHADRKSTRLNSSHVEISYAVFCLKKKIDERRADRR